MKPGNVVHVLRGTASMYRTVHTRLTARLKSHSGLHAIAANSGWLLLDRGLRIVLAVLVGAWVARHLGPERYGELAYWMAVVAVLQVVCTLGLDSIAVRDIARDPDASGLIMGTTLRLRLGCGFLCWIAAVSFCLVTNAGDLSSLAIVAFLGLALLCQPADIVDLWLQSQTRSRESIPGKAIAYCTSAAMKVALVLSDAPLWSFASALGIEAVLTAVALVWTYRREPTHQRLRWAASQATYMLRESWPFLIAGLSVMVYMRIDQFVLRSVAGEKELGIYSAVLPISLAWHVIPMTVCASVLPRLSVLKQSHPALYRRRLSQLFSLMAWGGAACAAVTSALAPWLVGGLLGGAYESSVAVLRWHSITNIFVFLGVAQSVAIVSDGNSHIALVRTLIGAVVSLIMNLWLVPIHGALGAAWAAVGAYASAAVLSNAILAPGYLMMQLKALLFIHAPRT